MEISNNYSYMRQENRIPRYRDFLHDTTNSNSNNRRERENYLYSINNNISTSLSSYDKINDKNAHRYTKENNIIKTTNRSRSRSPCFCGCHLNDECIYPPNHCTPICHYDHIYTHYSNNIISKNEEIKKNDDLLNEIIYLKRNLKRVENELNRAKTEKDASDFYIKQLEKELSKLNMSNIVEPKRRMDNSPNIRDFSKYHEMLNKSFEVLDSVSNQCNDPRGQTKGGVNYYYDRQQDYNIVIDTQKKWLDNLPNSKFRYNENDNMNNISSTLKGSDNIGTNKFSNSGYPDDNSKLNVFKYPESYININDDNSNINNDEYHSNDPSTIKNMTNNKVSNIPNKKNKYIPYNPLYNNNINYQRNNRKNNSNIIPNNKSSPNHINNKNNSMGKNNNIFINDNSNEKKNNKSIPYPKSNNKNMRDNEADNENNSYFPNKNIIGESCNNKEGVNNNENEKEEDEEDRKQKEKEDILKRRYLVVDNNENPIFIDGKRLLGMEILPIIGEDGKEELDENGNIIFLGPDGQPKTQEDLEPIILDNDLPLVNEENKPFLGINGIIMVNRFGNPIVGPGELYDKDNKVVHGELGIFPTDNQGNLIKFNIPGESFSNNDNNFNDNDDNLNQNHYDMNSEVNNNNYNKNDDNYNKDENNNYNNTYDNEDINNKENSNENPKNDKENNSNSKNRQRKNDNNEKYSHKNNKRNSNTKINNNNNKNGNNIHNIKNNNEEEENNDNKLNIKPLIGSDGRPVLDKNNSPIFLDDQNKPIKGKGIAILLDQSGMPVLNTIGEPILINKDGKPINLIEKEDNKMNNPKLFYPNLEKNYNRIKPNKNNKKKRYKNDNMNDNPETGKFNNNPILEKNKNEYKYPKPNQNYQRKLNYKPISNTSYNQKEYSSSCFACDVGCAVSRSGYSPMTYSPYDNRIKRREVTPLKNE